MPRGEGSVDTPVIAACGDDLLGMSFADTRECQQVADALRQTGSWLESVAGIASVIVRFDAAAMDAGGAHALLEEQLRSVSIRAASEAGLAEIPVCYGGEFGPDLDAVCGALGLTRERFVALHTGGEFRVDMLGFTPGFAYIGGLPDELNVPRLAAPRQRVAAGSVGIADGRSGLYAMPGPGGWPIIGRTPERLFDAAAEQPILLTAGMRVRFRQIGAEEFQEIAGR